ncbi:filamentous hemagglutinin N-terminal domain-containing protein [bacterium]|nr:filamentous hemagglutinin N-terminal domain-containing protein [bacterium]
MMTARKAKQSFRWSNTLRRSTAISAAMAVAGVSGVAMAGPQGGHVVSGSATISHPSAVKTDIHQNSNKTIINWRSFNTTPAETVQFYQPGASAIALNRVTNGQVTVFQGALKANGNVWLINESGVMFSNTAKIDVGGLLASTANITNKDFNAGRYVFSQPGQAGAKVINQGTITAKEGGLVALVAPGVENSGVIQANLGKVALAAGETYTLDFYGDKLINFVVPDQKAGSVKMDGVIEADGGKVQITANEASDVVSQSINVSGVVRANRMQYVGGEIVIDAGNGGKAEVSGNVSAKGVGGQGGSVKVLGGDVAVKSGATIDTSGELGGGEILVGGNFQGKGPERNATSTVIEEGATLKSDATVNGDGGRVIVWSNDTTGFMGSISAQGVGAGKGGFAEVSGKESFVFLGDVNLNAESGIAGDLLLDPSYIIIHSGSLNIWPWNSVENRNIVSASALANALKNANVTLDSDSFIDVGTRADYSEYGPLAGYLAGLLLGNGDINVSTSGLTTTTHNLTLSADVVNFNRNLTMGTGNVFVNAPTTNLNGQIFNNVGTLLDSTKLSGNSSTVNVKSNAAKIQQGVHIAGTGATVNVAAGNYAEQVKIGKNLNLVGSGVGVTNIVAPGALANNVTVFGTPRTAIIGVEGANNVNISNLTVDGNQNGAAAPGSFTGIAYGNAGGTVDHVEVKGVRHSGNSGVQGGNGIYAGNDDGVARTLNVSNSVVKDFQKNGITTNGDFLTANITNNTITGAGAVDYIAQNGIQLGYGATGTISGNSISEIGYTPDSWSASSILVFDAADGVQVTNNTVTGSGHDIGVAVVSTSHAVISGNNIAGSDTAISLDGGLDPIYVGWGIVGGSASNSIDHNTITGAVTTGIDVLDASATTIDGNVIHHGAKGIVVTGATGDTQIKNNVLHNLVGNAISLFSSTGSKILSNFIGQNEFGVSQGTNNIVGDGILIADSDHIDIKGNKITETHSPAWDVGSGIQALRSHDVTIGGTGVGEGNVITNSGWDGIRVDAEGGSVYNFDVLGNVIDGVERVGMYTENLTNSYLRFNVIGNVPMYGAIYSYGGTGLNIIGNHLGNSNANGILVAGLYGTNTINDNWVNYVGGDGIRSENVSGTLNVTNNHIGHSIFFSPIVSDHVNGNGITLINTAGANVSGNAVDNFGYTGIWVDPSPNTSVTNNTITGGAYGVVVLDSDNVTVGGANAGDRNYIDGAGVGIYVQNSHSTVLDNNKIDNSKYQAVYATASNNLDIKNNVINGSGTGAIDPFQLNAIEVHGGNGHHITGNTVTGAGWDGISISDATNAIASGNVIANSFRSAFALGGGSGNTISGNTLNNNWGGMWISYGTDTDIIGNTINGTTAWHGIYVESNETGITIDDNTITGAALDGIYARNSNTVTVQNNSISGSGVDGIYVTNLSGTTNITNNKVNNSGNDGIDVDGSTGVVQITYNNINGTGTVGGGYSGSDGYNGIEVSGTTNAVIYTNTVTGAAWDGVNLQDSTGAKILSNTISNTQGASGVGVLNSSNTEIATNTITNSYQYGMYIGGHTGTLNIHDNTVTGATLHDGIYVTGSQTPWIEKNTINNVAGDAISVYASSNATVKKNKIGLTGGANNIGSDGVSIVDSASSTVTGNEIVNVVGSGVFIDPSPNSAVIGNTITGGANGVYVLSADNVTVGGANAADRNFITGSGTGVRVENSAGSNVWNNSITGSLGDGVYVSGLTGTNVIQGNTVSGSGDDGIEANGSAGVTIKKNKVSNSHDNGIALWNSAGATVGGSGSSDGNTISGSGWDGVNVWYSDNAQILRNAISDSTGASGVGVLESANVKIDRNNIQDVARLGIYGGNVDNVQITNNTIKGAGLENSGTGWLSGIHVEATDGLTITGNDIDGTKGDGINSGGAINYGSANNTGVILINSNKVKNVARHGIYGSANVDEVKSNTINGAGGDGIEMNSSADVVIQSNKVGLTGGANNITGDGINVNGSVRAHVNSNEISNTVRNGIYINGSNYAEALSNIISKTGLNGIYVNPSDYVQVKLNSITSAGLDGISILGGKEATIDNNTIAGGNGSGNTMGADGAVRDGIHVDGNKDVVISNNQIKGGNGTVGLTGLGAGGKGAGANGIFVTGSTGANIHHNQIKGGNAGATFSGITAGGIAAGANGIQLVSNNNAHINSNAINRVGNHGIYVQNSNSTDVSLNTIGDGINYGAVVDGINIEGGRQVSVDNNTIQGGLLNAQGAGHDGIHVVNNREARITNNTVKSGLGIGSEGAGNHGIYADNSGAIIGGGFDAILGQLRSGIVVTGNKIIAAGLSKGAVVDGIHINNSAGGLAGARANVSGNTVTWVGNDGIFVSNTNGVLVDNNGITLAGDDGIDLRDSNLAHIGTNTVTGAGDVGIFVDPSSFVVVENNTVTGAASHGIQVQYGLSNTVRNNSVSLVGGDGINIDQSALANVTGNTVTGAEGDGIHVYGSLGSHIGGNNVTLVGLDGVEVISSSGSSITDNTVTGAGEEGIDLSDSSLTTISGNHVTGTASHGILVDGGLLNQITGNNVTLALGGDGIHVNNSQLANISDNLVTLVTGDGIEVLGSNGSLIGNNTVTGAGEEGIDVSGSSLVGIIGNTVTGTGSHGILLNGGLLNKIKGNTVTLALGGDGIHADNNWFLDVSNNLVTLSFQDGIEVTGTLLSSIADNTVTGAGEEGIELSGSSLTTISGNQVTGTGSHGIAVDGGILNSVLGNTVTLALGGDGIHVNNSWFSTIAGNGVFLAAQDGIDVNGSLLANIHDNTVAGAGENGIKVSNSWLSRIVDNTVTLALGDGINVSNSWFSTVAGNGVTLVGHDGIDVDGSLLANIHDNTVVGAGENGIKVSNSWLSRIVDNTVALVLGNGIDLRDSSFAYINGNNVFLVGDNGIFVDPSSFVTVANNTVIGAVNNGIEVQDGIFNTVRNNSVALVGGDGIHVSNSWFANVLDNTVMGALHDGIYVEGSGFANVNGNTVGFTGDDGIDVRNSFAADVNDNNVFLTLGDGIQVRDSAFADIKRNTVTGAADDGIDVEGSAFADVNQNRVSFVLHNGIEVSDSFNADVIGNRVAFAGHNGIDVDNADYGDIRGNDVIFAGNDGIHVEDSRYVDVKGNVVAFVLGDGIDVDHSRGADIRRNRIAFAGDNGIEVSDSRDANIDNNVVAFVLGDGIHVNDSRNVDVNHNFIVFALHDGIDVDGSRNADINRNRIAFVGDNGIELSDSRNSDINGNRIAFTGGNGIDVDNSDYTDVRRNDIFRPGENGVEINDSFAVDVDHNTIRGAGDNGVLAYHADLLRVRGNSITGSNEDGVHVSYSDGVHVLRNTISGSGDDGVDISYSGTYWDDLPMGLMEDSSEGGEGSSGTHTVVARNDISDSGTHGVRAYETNDIRISRNIITDSGVDGVNLGNSDYAKIRRNTITGAGSDGVDVWQDAGYVMAAKNLYSEDYEGYYYGTSYGVEVTDNVITGTSESPITENGVRATNVGGILIADNTISGQSFGDIGEDGVHLENASYGQVLRNIIYNVGSDGVEIASTYADEMGSEGGDSIMPLILGGDGSVGIVVSDNTIGAAGQHGINAYDADGLVTERNVIGTSELGQVARDGIHIFASDNVVVRGNTITGAGEDGIDISGVQSETVPGDDSGEGGSDQVFQLFAGPSFFFTGSSNNALVEGNVVTDSAENGIKLTDTPNAQVLSNTVTGSGDAGIYALRADGLQVGSNVVDTASDGIYVDDSQNTVLRFNRITNATRGIHLINSETDLQDNTVVGGQDGLVAEGADGFLQFVGVNNVFQGQSRYFIDLENNFMDNQVIDARGVYFNGIFGGTATPAQIAYIETKLHDQDDESTVGQIFSLPAAGPSGFSFFLSLLEQLFRDRSPEPIFSIAGQTIETNGFNAPFGFTPVKVNLSLNGSTPPATPNSFNVAGMSDTELAGIAPAAGPGAQGGQSQQGENQGGSSGCAAGFLSSGFSPAYNMGTCQVSQ